MVAANDTIQSKLPHPFKQLVDTNLELGNVPDPIVEAARLYVGLPARLDIPA